MNKKYKDYKVIINSRQNYIIYLKIARVSW